MKIWRYKVFEYEKFNRNWSRRVTTAVIWTVALVITACVIIIMVE